MPSVPSQGQMTRFDGAPLLMEPRYFPDVTFHRNGLTFASSLGLQWTVVMATARGVALF